MSQARKWQLGEIPWESQNGERPRPRARVIIDNDFSGDPDGLVQVAHHVMSPSVDIRAIIASHARADDPSNVDGASSTLACARLARLFDVMRLDATDSVVRGANERLLDRSTPRDTPAARAIIAEAMRESDLPLFVACGGGLTDLASAYLIEPAIAHRLTVVWIGGTEYDLLADVDYDAPGFGPEYNVTIDVAAAQVVLNDSALPVWQVPRDAYKQCLVAQSELRRRAGKAGATGKHLEEAIASVRQDLWSAGWSLAETYVLGDSPLVLLTALTGFWTPDTSSSQYTVLPAPVIDDDGNQITSENGRPIRVYTHIDTRLMFEDLFCKLEELATWQSSTPMTTERATTTHTRKTER